MEKKKIREEILELKGKLGENDLKYYSDTIINKVYDSNFFKDAHTIMTYISFENEVDTHEFIKNSIKMGKEIVVPITIAQTKELKVSKLMNFNELEIGFYNILTPKKEFIRFIDPKEIDLIIVPGVAFDRKGYRIGYGGGYYDRFLSQLDEVDKISLAFQLQVIEEVPKEYFDIPVDFIFTENEIIQCK